MSCWLMRASACTMACPRPRTAVRATRVPLRQGIRVVTLVAKRRSPSVLWRVTVLAKEGVASPLLADGMVELAPHLYLL